YEGMRDLRECFERGTGQARDLLPKQRGGYRAEFARHQVDLHRFQDGYTAARQLLGHDDAAAAEAFHEALGEWGDPAGQQPREPLAGLDARWLLGYRESLREGYRAARNACWQAELRLGRHDQLIPALSHQVQANPTDENLVEMLMIAYYR